MPPEWLRADRIVRLARVAGETTRSDGAADSRDERRRARDRRRLKRGLPRKWPALVLDVDARHESAQSIAEGSDFLFDGIFSLLPLSATVCDVSLSTS